MQNSNLIVKRGFGSYIIIEHIKIPVENGKNNTETIININNYINDYMRQNGKDLNYNKHGMSNITVTGNWSLCKLITGTQVINQLENNKYSNTDLQFNIPTIAFCKAMDYFIYVESENTVYLSIDIVEFNGTFNFDNSHINSPESYYVVKVSGSNINNNCNNYLRFMSSCAGLAF